MYKFINNKINFVSYLVQDITLLDILFYKNS